MRQMLPVLLFATVATSAFAQTPTSGQESPKLIMEGSTRGSLRQPDGTLVALNLTLKLPPSLVVTAEQAVPNATARDWELRGDVRVTYDAPPPTGNHEPSLTIKSNGMDLQQAGVVRLSGGVTYVFPNLELTADEASMNTVTHAVELRGNVHMRFKE